MLLRRTLITGALFATALGVNNCARNGAPPPSARRLKFQASWSNDSEFLGYYVALDPAYDFYRKRKLTLDYLQGGPDIVPESSLLNGKADIALTTPETTTQMIVRDRMPFRIIGAQYQKNPVGIVSLAKNPVRTVHDLAGKRLAVPAVNRPTVEAVLTLNGMSVNDVKIVPYLYDPQILLSGAADATIDFITNVPYAIRKLGGDPVSLSFYDVGFKIFNDVLVVTATSLERRLDEYASFIAASTEGWKAAFDAAPDYFAKRYMAPGGMMAGNGRTIENETDFNINQRALIDSPTGIYSMTPTSIKDNLAALKLLNIDVDPVIFDTRALERAGDMLARRGSSAAAAP
jgi:ABC-type nitrate/sulfonate/bicarbonate transport system substrate-binding protein